MGPLRRIRHMSNTISLIRERNSLIWDDTAPGSLSG